MSKFNVGDRVRVLDTFSDEANACFSGKLGTVIEVGADNAVVSFKFKGAMGWDKGEHKHCWWVEDAHLRLTDAHRTTAASEKPSQAYLGNGKHEWEQVTTERVEARVMRLRVPGGWLYKPRLSAAVFVPMPEVVKHKV